jgi:hypothetical protein
MTEESVSEAQPLAEYVTSSEEADWADSSDTEDRARMMLAEDEASRAAEMQAHDQMDTARDLAGRMASSDDSGDLGEWVVNDSE